MSAVAGSGVGSYDVHLGFWTNWSYGKVQGATLTLIRRDGNFLIAFLAIFVAATGQSFWRIGCFIFHRLLSSASPEDGLYHQRQAILRNANSAQDAAWRLLNVHRVWRKNGRRPFLRLFPIIAFALLVSGAFNIASIFSSRVTSDTGNEVLISGKNCGPLHPSATDGDGELRVLEPYLAQRATAHLNYALQCYADALNPEDCRQYVKPNLPITLDANASCPFAEEMCKTKSNNLILDTGYLDSHHDLGINAPPKDRFQLRFVHQCAPVVSEGFSAIYNAGIYAPNNTLVPGLPVMRYYYGNVTFHDPDNYTGFSYEVPYNFSNMHIEGYTSAVSARPDYDLGLLIAYAGLNDTADADICEFSPIPALQRSDADVILFFLTAEGIGFSEEVDDLWYGAHYMWKHPIETQNGTTSPLYLKDEPASVLGCTFQVQFCNPNLPEDTRCEPLRGLIDSTYPTSNLWHNEGQRNTAAWVNKVLEQGLFTISSIPEYIGVTTLTARYGLVYGLQGPLPDNQWQLEAAHFVGASMASLQGAFVEAANGPPTTQLKEFQYQPNDTQSHFMCTNQKIISTLYSSFNVLGLSIIIGLGSIIILLDLTLEPLIGAYQKRHLGSYQYTYARLEWHTNSILQLQRLAHEQIGAGTWLRADGETPVTLPGDRLAVLDIKDGEHPLLRPPHGWELRSDEKKGGGTIIHVRDTPPEERIKKGLVRENSEPVRVEDISAPVYMESSTLPKV
ncbi:hypothetical protein AOQ84DRAFT_388517 [Glonium stellatum]|uniref:Uncharacterized protein n=1 Tax=Glonium stellatum TaxID=574774 RepID=A0A8E2F1L5_9PEZI|nr:hypothetical protein AOQ84DRAFT_388517 [Glonium stellatum]